MFKQVYKRAENWRPACRRHYFSDAVCRAQGQPLLKTLCVCDVVPNVNVVVWRCSRCDLGWLPSASEVLVCPLPTKATREGLASSSGSNARRSTMFDSFPEIWGFLTSTDAPDGSKRLPGHVSLSLDVGLWTCALNDPATGLYCALTSSDLDALVLMVESRLAEGTMPWKISKYPPKKK